MILGDDHRAVQEAVRSFVLILIAVVDKNLRGGKRR